MDKRTVIALLLAALVIVVTQLLFPSSPQRSSAGAKRVADTVSTAMRNLVPPPPPSPATTLARDGRPIASEPLATSAVRGDTFALHQSVFNYRIGSRGADVLSVTLDDSAFRNLQPNGRRQGVTLAQPRGPLVSYRLVSGPDTVLLDTVTFGGRRDGNTVYLSSKSPAIDLAYSVGAKGYPLHVEATGAGVERSQLLIDLPNTIRSQEADTLDDLRHLAFAYKPVHDDVQSVSFGKLDSTTTRTDAEPIQWVAVRNKYFLVTALAPAARPFSALQMRGGSRTDKTADVAYGRVVLPANGGQLQFDLFAGPQSLDQLHSLGSDLENVNPYAGWLHGVVQPFATIVMRVLLWMKATLRINYGWVLVIFGVFVRLLLWPLNQSAMRSSMKMQRLQPEMTEIQKRYKTDPEKQRDAMMRLYKDHGMSPFSPMMGCLPMLIPMPVLFALYFVFQNTIEFRGVSFLWLPDLSLRDPFYITPLFMGVSMFVLSWIGMRGVPPTPQSKTMAYMMPVMFTVMFLSFPSGLNLYYAVQNVAALPQQFVLSRERKKTGGGKPPGNQAS
jgi:YidC/Oxa1 family membrane protein insertase